MWPILTGIETEYGLLVEGRKTVDQIDDSAALVRESPDKCFFGWDYRFESPRNDLRGWQHSSLAVDPIDTQFDKPGSDTRDSSHRNDLVLPNGCRFYNDHGHPEITTPECLSLTELVRHDIAGERIVWRAAQAYGSKYLRRAYVYKNNSDGHGASYGTHENYLIPRSMKVEDLLQCLVPILVARQVFCGAGKIGAEIGEKCEFQISQRADFLTEVIGIDTLFKRPILNTRDEPHARQDLWKRLHVISGDANLWSHVTCWKTAVVRLCLWLIGEGIAPQWQLAHPPKSMSAVSKDLSLKHRIPLANGTSCSALEILEELISSSCKSENFSNPMFQESHKLASEALACAQGISQGDDLALMKTDWGLKMRLLETIMPLEDLGWNDPQLKSYELAFHEIDPNQNLFDAALITFGLQDPMRMNPSENDFEIKEKTRAWVRSLIVTKFPESIESWSWGAITLKFETSSKVLELPPDKTYPDSLEMAQTVDEFVNILENLP